MLTSLLSLWAALPTQAQSWQIAVTGTPTATSGTGTTWTAPGPGNGSLSLPSYTPNITLSTNPGQTASGSAAYTAVFHFILNWQPSAGNVPVPAIVRVSKTPLVGWQFNGLTTVTSLTAACTLAAQPRLRIWVARLLGQLTTRIWCRVTHTLYQHRIGTPNRLSP